MTDEMMTLRTLLEKSSDTDLLREMYSGDDAEADVLAFISFPKDHRLKIHSINPLERLNGEIKRRTDVVGIFHNEDAITRLIGALLLEQNDEWAVQRGRYMSLETIAPLSDDPIIELPAVEPDRSGPAGDHDGLAVVTPLTGTRSQSGTARDRTLVRICWLFASLLLHPLKSWSSGNAVQSLSASSFGNRAKEELGDDD